MGTDPRFSQFEVLVFSLLRDGEGQRVVLTDDAVEVLRAALLERLKDDPDQVRTNFESLTNIAYLLQKRGETEAVGTLLKVLKTVYDDVLEYAQKFGFSEAKATVRLKSSMEKLLRGTDAGVATAGPAALAAPRAGLQANKLGQGPLSANRHQKRR